MRKIQKQDIATLLRMMKSFVQSVEDPFDCIDACFRAIVAIFDAERGFVLVFEGKDGKELSPFVGQGVEIDTLFITEEISQTIINSALEEQKPFFISNAMEDSRFSEKISVVVSGIRSVLCVPLISSSGFFGLLYLDDRHSEGFYTAEDRDLLIECVKEFSEIIVSHAATDFYFRPAL